jgi:hypothetical protein
LAKIEFEMKRFMFGCFYYKKQIWCKNLVIQLQAKATVYYLIVKLRFEDTPILPDWRFTLKSNTLTLSSLLVRLLVSALWFDSSSLVLLQMQWIINRSNKNKNSNKLCNLWQTAHFFFAYPLSRFKSNRCPAVTLSISYLYHKPCDYTIKIITYQIGTAMVVDQDQLLKLIKIYLSSLRIFSISFLSFSVSCCNSEKWCPWIIKFSAKHITAPGTQNKWHQQTKQIKANKDYNEKVKITLKQGKKKGSTIVPIIKQMTDALPALMSQHNVS